MMLSFLILIKMILKNKIIIIVKQIVGFEYKMFLLKTRMLVYYYTYQQHHHILQ